MIPPTIRADVFDIRESANAPKSADRFVVDTNVWLWITLPHQGASKAYQSTLYPNFVAQARKEGAQLLHVPGSLTELGRVLEGYAVSVAVQKGEIGDDSHGRKALRRTPGHRRQLAEDLEDAWRQIRAISDEVTTAPDADRLIELFGDTELDAGDAALVAALPEDGAPAVLTDDQDFGTVPALEVFTANMNALGAAAKARRLRVRS